MKTFIKRLFVFLVGFLLMSSCTKHDFDSVVEENNRAQIENNVKNVFGITFDPTHDWKTVHKSSVTISGVQSDVKTIQVIALVHDTDTTTSMFVLNQEEDITSSTVKIYFDEPNENLGLFLGIVKKDGSKDYQKITGETVAASARSITRALPKGITLPSENTLVLTECIQSYASERGWIETENLYSMAEYGTQSISVKEYPEVYKEVFRAVIFSYFKNGRAYNNLPLVINSGIYNDKAYPFTTGEDPILISPVYKNDGGFEEIVNSDLYYYYFKDEDLGDDPVGYIKSLPKYKAIPFAECIKGDDEISKHVTYALAYWGDGQPSIGKKGSYKFPSGYRIGFMVRAMSTAEEGKKQGELYGDGRLNNEINNYKPCNFKSSKLGKDGPRAAWINVAGKNFICFESGTDADFNDIILEVEGGITTPIYIPDIDYDTYTYCFEDHDLGDYDMNDVVIRATRKSSTEVEYSVVACGAYDEVYIKNINGVKINDSKEVHAMFNVPQRTFVNTVPGVEYPVIKETITVAKEFSFLDEDTQPHIYNKTEDREVFLSKTGEDPHAIMIPNYFRWPIEKTCIKDSYRGFNSWGQNKVTSTDWYFYPEDALVY